MRFEIEKFQKQKPEYWRPESGEYFIVIDFSKKPKIITKKFKSGEKTFAVFEIEVSNGSKIERKLWIIPIARVEGETVYFWANSQRGKAIAEIARKYGYTTHVLKVKVKRDPTNPLNTQYHIEHSTDCPCLKNKSEIPEILKKRLEEIRND